MTGTSASETATGAEQTLTVTAIAMTGRMRLMYDDLVKRLRELHPEEFGNKWDFAFACQQAMHEAADAIEELSKRYLAAAIDNTNLTGYLAEEYAKHQWVSVTERLPEVGKNVLVFAYGNEITIGRMKRQTENGYHVFIICHGIARELARPGRITHWMPLPSAPESPKEET